MKALPEKINRVSLLALPERKWDQETVYDSLYVVPTRKKHDSGYALQAIVGVVRGDPQQGEIAAYCDDLCWTFPMRHPYDRIEQGKHRMIMRTDCLYPSGIFRIWASGEHYFKGRFRVGHSLSSTDVELVVEPIGDSPFWEQSMGKRLALVQ